ncbi:LOW QUALITY PROTEIN: hypothetical protein PHMEG_00025553 [Phytophthora megakarya]|uniref:Uncharacterized protein n=1 Tax=Phytophthora megakarya TaxID=4795 RepID=A0A225VD02_9STRA|nr:LOW QUALITY PROTEIN: hypothetical protein PHMEG_00025553 [Phytophthora megakarya]
MPQLKSVKSYHVLREFNVGVDSLATKALESKISKVVLDESHINELAGLNRTREVICDSSETKTEVKPVAQGSTQLMTTISASRPKPFADFVQTVQTNSTSYVLAVTRCPATTQKKRVRFADDSVTISEETILILIRYREHASESHEDWGKRTQYSTKRKRCRPRGDPNRIANAQDEELKWLNLKTVLRGDTDKLKYRAARDTLEIAERFLLTDDNVLYFMHSSPRNQ